MSGEFGIKGRSLGLILAALAEFPGVERAVLFGSRAMGNYRPGSDIDVALFGPGLGFSELLRLAARLNEVEPIPYRVDLVWYEGCDNEELRRHIDGFGKPIYERGAPTGPTRESR